jgi:hypothetical protein
MRNINFKGSHFPISRSFLIFLAKEFGGSIEYDDSVYWGDQHLELNQQPADISNLSNTISLIKDRDDVKFLINKAHHIAANLLISNKELISSIQNDYKFYLIVSPPRSGGTYITKNLYTSLGVNPKSLPSFFGHDGFPSVNHDWYTKNNGVYANFVQTTLWQFSEWLTMSDYYLPKIIDNSGKKVVIIKMINSYNNLNFFRSLLGGDACFILNRRPIIDLYFSVADKAGGIVGDAIPVEPRNNIEKWIIKENLSRGSCDNNINKSYIEALGRYYYVFYMKLLVGGFMDGEHKVVNYNQQSMGSLYNSIVSTYADKTDLLEEFVINDYSERYKKDLQIAADCYDDRINSLFNFFN